MHDVRDEQLEDVSSSTLMLAPLSLESSILVFVMPIISRSDAAKSASDITVLGNLKNIELIMKDGKIQKFYDQPERKPISGWRVTNLGEILTQDVAKNKLKN